MDVQAILDITVAPKSSRNKISIDSSNSIKIYLTAPPVDGKANAELISLLSKTLKVPKSSITIIHGETGKKKRVSIIGLPSHRVINKLKGI
ncbi:MAG TPA: DUF167 domain-containing protein [Spirochaetota bacterium]|nr:DUF167 domain-containing protein [Spirochaetota bacterium]HPN11305.1 DUF167 domain-containing protein [Spirochaetota bacterium]HQL81935.1 DUF167 domain-containing protein [Spirochaetota bacterium]